MRSLRTAQAVAREAKERSRRMGRAVTTSVTERYGDDARVQKVAERYDELRSTVADRSRGVTESTRAGLAKASDTAAARKVGDATRWVSREVQKLPLLSLANDAIARRHGVHLLAASFKEDPTDPERALWLAEALQRAARDRRLYVGAKTLVDPTSLLTRTGVELGARLGADQPTVSIEQRLLAIATARAAARARADRHDTRALHVLARVHLAHERPDDGIRLCKLALAADPSSGEVLYTLARCYEAQGRLAASSQAAGLALRHGCSLAYELLAELEHRRDDEKGGGGLNGSKERIARALRLRERVEEADRQSYWGVSVSAADVAGDVASAQWKKAKSTTERVVGLVTERRT
jgi:hypothetical protein